MTENTHEGIIMIRGRGVGFVTLPDFEEDIFIEQEKTGTALDGDVIRLTLLPKRNGERQSGEVIEVLERAREEYIGIVEKNEDGVLELRPDSKRIHKRFVLPDAREHDIGMKVAVSLTSWEDPESNPKGKIIDTLGPAGNHETEMQAIIRSGGFVSDFPPQVAAAARELYERHGEIMNAAEKDEKRRDFRDVPTCTIDPDDAKDFDDALSFRTLENGNYEIGVHIADVSHYVTPGSSIDEEARERATSIYLVDRVIPMLPEVLSNDLCSLRPEEDRLAFSAVFEINEQADVVGEWYGQTLIHSDHRYTYHNAQDTIESGEGPLAAELQKLMELSRIIRKERYKSGAIAFEQPEVKFKLAEDGTPLEVTLKERIETMLMIEDYMLLANRKVAEYVNKINKGNDVAFIYRTHDAPKPEKIEELGIFLRALGYEFRSDGGVVEAKDINALLEEIEGTPEENLIKTATIRSMAKAVYTTKNIGHFGLAFAFYTHFTSPIRRYPDLMVHRLLRKHLDGKEITPQERARYERLSIHASEREMHAVSAERESIKFKQVEYMQNKIGEEFDGVITGVTEWGIYVEEKNTKAEGMVHISKLGDDFFTYDQKNYRVVGERTKEKYQLGDEVRIRLTGANLEDRQLDFELVK